MKRKAKSSGSGGRLRLGLLLAAVSAFLLVPAASAFANVTAEISFAGEGAGWVEGEAGAEGGEPEVKCHWNGTEIDVGMEGSEVKAGVCKTAALPLLGEGGIFVFQEADPLSEFAGWTVLEGVDVSGCSPAGCGVAQFAPSPAGIKIKATFNKIPLPKFTLTTSTSGTSGSVECKINGGAKGPCPEGIEEVEETSSVEMFAEPGTGNELNEWTSGPCENESTNPCSFTMEEDTSANADFKVASESLSVTEGGGGSGSVACEVNSESKPCNGTYEYGDSVTVVATPASENIVESITGAGSAAGNCVVVGAGESGECSFTIEATSSVNVVFAPAGTKVEGEVPNTTSLTGCELPVVLGPFIPAVNANYEGTCSLIATSTGSATELSAADLSGNETGHLVQGSYRLPSALETRATGLGNPPLEFPGTGGSFAPLSAPSVTLLTYAGPVSADNVTVRFKQHIGLHDALHTGTYSKPITLTLEQTAP